MRKSRTVPPHLPLNLSGTLRHVPLVELMVDATSELFELARRSGLKVLEAKIGGKSDGTLRTRYAHVVGSPRLAAGR